MKRPDLSDDAFVTFEQMTMWAQMKGMAGALARTALAFYCYSRYLEAQLEKRKAEERLSQDELL